MNTMYQVPKKGDEIIRKIAHTYINTPPAPFQDKEAFQRWIHQQYGDIPYRVEFVSFDPYRDHSSMGSEVRSTGTLRIADKHNVSVFDPLINLQFRAVHDQDHLRIPSDFSLHGEMKAYREFASRCRDEWTKALLFSEIVGQSCVAIVNGKFPEQKFVPFSKQIRDLAMKVAVPEYFI